MKTLALSDGLVSLELTEFEMTVLCALVEQGQQRLQDCQEGGSILHSRMTQVATEFRSVLGHFDLTEERA